MRQAASRVSDSFLQDGKLPVATYKKSRPCGTASHLIYGFDYLRTGAAAAGVAFAGIPSLVFTKEMMSSPPSK